MSTLAWRCVVSSAEKPRFAGQPHLPECGSDRWWSSSLDGVAVTVGYDLVPDVDYPDGCLLVQANSAYTDCGKDLLSEAGCPAPNDGAAGGWHGTLETEITLALPAGDFDNDNQGDRK